MTKLKSEGGIRLYARRHGVAGYSIYKYVDLHTTNAFNQKQIDACVYSNMNCVALRTMNAYSIK